MGGACSIAGRKLAQVCCGGATSRLEDRESTRNGHRQGNDTGRRRMRFGLQKSQGGCVDAKGHLWRQRQSQERAGPRALIIKCR